MAEATMGGALTTIKKLVLKKMFDADRVDFKHLSAFIAPTADAMRAEQMTAIHLLQALEGAEISSFTNEEFESFCALIESLDGLKIDHELRQRKRSTPIDCGTPGDSTPVEVDCVTLADVRSFLVSATVQDVWQIHSIVGDILYNVAHTKVGLQAPMTLTEGKTMSGNSELAGKVSPSIKPPPLPVRPALRISEEKYT